jgi:hypothetical protein
LKWRDQSELIMKNCLVWALLFGYAVFARAEGFVHQTSHRPAKVFDANGHVIGDLQSFSGVSGVRVVVGNAATVAQIGRARDASGHDSATDFTWATSALPNLHRRIAAEIRS